MLPTPEAGVRAWFEEVWNQGREEAIDRLFSAAGVAHDLPSTDSHPGARSRGVQAVLSNLPGGHSRHSHRRDAHGDRR